MTLSDIIVADTFHHQIQVFDPQGKFLFKFGTQGANGGQLISPTSVCTDTEDNILVLDANKRVQVFDQNGNFKCKLSGPSLKFSDPGGLAFNKQTNQIVVIEL